MPGTVRSATRVVTAGLLAAALSGCSGIKPGRTPSATFEAARRAVLEDDYEGLWRLLSGKARDAEALRIGEEKRQVESAMEQFTPDEKEQFRRKNGISPGDFVNLAPAEVFAMGLRQNARIMDDVRGVLLDARAKGVRLEGNRAFLRVEIPGEETVEVALVLDHGLYRLPSMTGFFEALGARRRARRAGRTPEETFRSLMACVADGAYDDLWELFTPTLKEHFSTMMRALQDQARSVPADQLRRLEREVGMPLEEYMKLSPKRLFAMQIGEQLDGRGKAQMLSRKFKGAVVKGDRAVVAVATAGGAHIQLEMGLRDGHWYLERFK